MFSPRLSEVEKHVDVVTDAVLGESNEKFQRTSTLDAESVCKSTRKWCDFESISNLDQAVVCTTTYINPVAFSIDFRCKFFEIFKNLGFHLVFVT